MIGVYMVPIGQRNWTALILLVAFVLGAGCQQSTSTGVRDGAAGTGAEAPMSGGASQSDAAVSEPQPEDAKRPDQDVEQRAAPSAETPSQIVDSVRDELEQFLAAFCDTYEKEDVDGYAALWNQQSPDFATWLPRFRKLFVSERVVMSNAEIVEIRSLDETSCRMLVQLLDTRQKRIGDEPPRSKQIQRILDLTRTTAGWRLNRYVPAELEFNERFMQTDTNDARDALLRDHSNLLTPSLCDELLKRAAELSSSNRFEEARREHEYAVRIAERLNHRRSIAITKYRLSEWQRSHGSLTRARTLLAEVVDLAAGLDDRLAALAAEGLAETECLRGQATAALQYAERAKQFAERTGDEDYLLRAEVQIERALLQLGELDRAEQIVRRLLARGEERNSDVLRVFMLTELGNIHSRRDDVRAAIQDFSQALAIARGFADPVELAQIEANLARLYGNQGAFATAIGIYDRIADVFEKAERTKERADILNNRGSLRDAMGAPGARDDFEAALAAYEKNGSGQGQVSALVNISRLQRRAGDPAGAANSCRRCLQLLQGSGDRWLYRQVRMELARALESHGDMEGAIGTLEEQLAESRARGDTAGVEEALHVLSRAGDDDARMSYARQTIELAAESGASSFLYAAHHHLALAHYKRGEMRECESALKNAVRAVESLRQAVLGSDKELIGFLDSGSRTEPYHSLVRFYAEFDRGSEALFYAESAKARTLLELLQQDRVQAESQMTAEEREREAAFKARIGALNRALLTERQATEFDAQNYSALQRELQESRESYDRFRDQLFQRYPELAVKRAEFRAIDSEQLSRLVPDDHVALVEFVVRMEKAVLIVVTRDGGLGEGAPSQSPLQIQCYFIQASPDELRDAAESIREQLARPRPIEGNQLHELYERLLGDASRQLAGRTRWIIVPDGPLWNLPFAALQPEPGRFLLEDVLIEYAPSLTALHHFRRLNSATNSATESEPLGPVAPPTSEVRSAPGNATVLAIGNPTTSQQVSTQFRTLRNGEALVDLPEAAEEARQIAAMYPENDVLLLVADEAREELFRQQAPRFDILHLATHGILVDRQPMHSFVALAPSPPPDGVDDGLLEAREIAQLQLHARLVVLSACETARGAARAGEGLIGMNWAFFAAGCPATVSSLWKVDDAATRALMVEFHRNMRERGQRPAEALRNAQLRMLNDFDADSSTLRGLTLQAKNVPEDPQTTTTAARRAAPFYWCAFVIVGGSEK
jgi:CHAT domain-containing protein